MFLNHAPTPTIGSPNLPSSPWNCNDISYNAFNGPADQLSFSGKHVNGIKNASHSHKIFPQNTIETQTSYFRFW